MSRKLGVIIDENLKWDVHTKYLNSKLKCEIGKLNIIKKCIPKIAYKELYHTLFESHLSYGISAWGGISFKKLEPLFITQKRCLRGPGGGGGLHQNSLEINFIVVSDRGE